MHRFSDFKSVKSQLLNTYIVSRILNKIQSEEIEGFNNRSNGIIKQFLIEGKIVLRFKKLNNKLLASNTNTELSFLYYNQYLVLKQDFIPQLLKREVPLDLSFINLFIGYRLNEFGTKIEDIHVVCPMGFKKNKWVHPIYELESSNPSFDYDEQKVDDSEQKSNVRLKRGIEKRDINNEEK